MYIKNQTDSKFKSSKEKYVDSITQGYDFKFSLTQFFKKKKSFE